VKALYVEVSRTAGHADGERLVFDSEKEYMLRAPLKPKKKRKGPIRLKNKNAFIRVCEKLLPTFRREDVS